MTVTCVSYLYLFISKSFLLSCTKQNKAHRAHPRCIPPLFYQHRNMSSYHQDNIASTTMWEPSRSTLSALHLSMVNLRSASIGELPRCTSSALWPYHLQHGNTHIYRYICKDWLWPNYWCNCNFGMYSLVFIMYCNPMFILGCICNVFESCHTPMFIWGSFYNVNKSCQVIVGNPPIGQGLNSP